jgi:hypothetical protein
VDGKRFDRITAALNTAGSRRRNVAALAAGAALITSASGSGITRRSRRRFKKIGPVEFGSVEWSTRDGQCECSGAIGACTSDNAGSVNGVVGQRAADQVLREEIKLAERQASRECQRDSENGIERITASSFEAGDLALRDHPNPVWAYDLAKRTGRPQQTMRDGLERLRIKGYLVRDETLGRNEKGVEGGGGGAARTRYHVVDPGKLEALLAAEAERRLERALEAGGYLPAGLKEMLASYCQKNDQVGDQEAEDVREQYRAVRYGSG